MISLVTKILREGTNFYKEKKMSANAMKDFMKDAKERKKLVKAETYYEMDSIKKLWRYVLRVVIELIYLDTRFDRVRTHHFVLLNHFRHGIKISFPFYLFTSLRKNIVGFKKKSSANLALHEGFLLLVYEYLKTQTRGKYLGHSVDALEDTRS